jgi:hypothetical protein
VTRLAKSAIAATVAAFAARMAIIDVSKFRHGGGRRTYARIKSGHDNRSHDHFANSAMASSANTPPVIAIGASGAFAASSALEIMI